MRCPLLVLGPFGLQIGPPDRFHRQAGRASRSTGPAHPSGPQLTDFKPDAK